MTTNSSILFGELSGKQLSAVVFVQDYLQLQFDGPTINVTNPLTVKSATGRITSWQSGFRDLLCSQITKIVAAVEHLPKDALIICFSDDSFISVSLRAEDYSSPEAFYAHGFANKRWIIE
ncbi:hypothetical protein BH09VER1_BH09VER1_55440 [soil metagenome]